MSNLLTQIIATLPSHNWTQNITNNTLKYFFYSYGEVIGLDIFFSFVVGVVAIALFIHSNRSIPITVGFFLLCQTFLAVALPSPFTIVLFIFAGLMSAGAAYHAYFKEK